MNFKSLDKAQIQDKQVVVRVDFNVPFFPDTNKISDSTRIISALPTIEHLLENNNKLVLISHLGRPKGKRDEKLSLDPVAKELSNILQKEIKFWSSFDQAGDLQAGEIALLENTRFFPGEEKNTKEFSKELASLGEVFVSDAFGSVHRSHASTVGIAQILPSYAGFLIEKEVKILDKVLKEPKKPLVLIVGGAKIDTKIGVLKNFLDEASAILVGGALANTFLYACGFEVGESLAQKDFLETAQEIMLEAEKHHEKFLLPEDVIVSDQFGDIDDKNPIISVDAEDVTYEMKIFDIGPKTSKKYEEVIRNAGTIIWNGPMGLTEIKSFSKGTKNLAKSIIKSKATSILGGGDTSEALKSLGINPDDFDHVSTGGGAMLEFLEGKKLPGLEVLA